MRELKRIRFFLAATGLLVMAASTSSAWAVTPTIDSGQGHSCLLTVYSDVQCWGSNQYGQLGDGSTMGSATNFSHTPVFVSGLTGVSKISTGANHTCAIVSGAVWCWGLNNYGQLGDGTTTNRNTPVQVSGITNATDVAAGSSHTCVIVGSGSLKCWGRNYRYQFGNGNTTDSTTPVSAGNSLTTFASITTGPKGDDVCARMTDSTAKCWGVNWYGQIGDNTTTDRTTPTTVLSAAGVTQTNVTSIVAGNFHVCAIISSSTMKCWGYNSNGQVGNGNLTNQKLPVTISGLSGVSQVDLGSGHSCAYTASTTYCWGLNSKGEVGDGTTTYRSSPVSISGLSGISGLGLGDEHTCALISGSSAKCWGWTNGGRAGTGSGTSTNQTAPGSVVSTYITIPPAPSMTSPAVNTQNPSVTLSGLAPGGGFNCMLDSGAWAACSATYNMSGLAEGSHTLQVKQTVSSIGSSVTSTTWTTDTVAPLAPTISSVSSPTRWWWDKTVEFTTSESGGTAECKLDSAVWGSCASYYNTSGTYSPGSLADGSHTIQIRHTDGVGNVSPVSSVTFTVDNTPPSKPTFTSQLPQNSELDQNRMPLSSSVNNQTSATFSWTVASDVASVSCETQINGVNQTYLNCTSPMTLNMSKDATNNYFIVYSVDQAGNQNNSSVHWNTDLTPPEPFDLNSKPRLLSNNTAPQFAFSQAKGVQQIDASGGETPCAVLISGKIKCWGYGGDGQLGNGSNAQANQTPVTVSGIDNAKQISSAGSNNCSRLSTGEVKCWGYGNDGQLGNGANNNSNVPVTVSGISNATQVAGLWDHYCALLQDHSVKCWGKNDAGQLGDGTNNNSNVPVAVSGISNVIQISPYCALLSTGEVKCWGWGTSDTSNIPVTVAGIDNATQVSSGGGTNCALLSTGEVKCWGSGYMGQLGDGSDTWSDNWTPVTVAGINNAVQVSVGNYGTVCALLSSGELKCWGGYDMTSLFGSASSYTDTPIAFPDINNAVQISVGGEQACVLLSTGDVQCWGYNGYGQLGDGSQTESYTPVNTLIYESASSRCSMDNANYSSATACSSPYNLSGLQDGSHTLRVWSVDLAGNYDTPTTYTWTVDTQAPLAPTITAPPSSSKASSRTISFTTAESGGSVQCKIDSGAWGACTSYVGTAGTYATGALAEGSHTFYARQNDPAGNQGAQSSVSWTIAPADSRVTSFAPAAGQSTSSAVVFALQFASSITGLTASDFTVGGTSTGWTVTRVRANGSTANYLITLSPASSTDGTVVLTLKANSVFEGDGSGTGPASAAVSSAFNADFTPPLVTSFTANGDGYVNTLSGRTYSMTFSEAISGLASADFTNNGSATSCVFTPASASVAAGSSVTVTVSGCSDGTVLPRLSALSVADGAGNNGPTNKADNSSSPTIMDTQAPIAPTITAPTALNNLSSLTVLFRVPELSGSAQCKLDSSAWTGCTSLSGRNGTHSLTGITGGNHTLQVRQVDQAGNLGVAASTTWTTDLVAPVAPNMTAPPGITNLTSLTVQFTLAEAGMGQCQINYGPWKTCGPTSIALTGLINGTNTLLVRQTDPAGNIGSASTVTWVIDTIKPALVSGIVKGKVTGSNTTLTSTQSVAQGSISQLEYSTSANKPLAAAAKVNANCITWSSSVTITGRVGIKWARVWDAAGNSSGWYPVGS